MRAVDELLTGPGAPPVGMNVEHVDLAVGRVIARRTDAQYPDGLTVIIGYEAAMVRLSKRVVPGGFPTSEGVRSGWCDVSIGGYGGLVMHGCEFFCLFAACGPNNHVANVEHAIAINRASPAPVCANDARASSASTVSE